jgi:hypothetical protein
MRLVVGIVGAAVVLSVGCGASVDQLRSRASFDLQCPEGQIQTTQIDDRTIGVRGCGQQATYVESCANPTANFGTGSDCTWVQNTDSRPSQ